MIADAPGGRSERRAGPVVTTVLTIVLGVALLVFSGIAAAAGFLLAFIGDACGSYGAPCNLGGLSVAIGVATLGPLVLAIAAIVVSIVLLALRRRFPWLVPVIGALLVILVWFGAYLAAHWAAGVPLSVG